MLNAKVWEISVYFTRENKLGHIADILFNHLTSLVAYGWFQYVTQSAQPIFLLLELPPRIL